MPDGGFLYLTDADGWFQVVRLAADGRSRTVLTNGKREHGEPGGGYGYAALPTPDGARFVHGDVHDALIDLVIAPIGGAEPVKRGRGRPPKNPPPTVAAGAGQVVNPWPGLWRSVGFTADGTGLVAIGESQDRPQDVWAAARARRRAGRRAGRARSRARCRRSSRPRSLRSGRSRASGSRSRPATG